MRIFSLLKSDISPVRHPQEDYFLISEKCPIFVVADGVSLKLDEGVEYPKNSGAGEVAKIFCNIVINEAEKRYDNFSEKDLKEIFNIGNDKISEYNKLQGRTKDTINYWDFDLFSTTTSFVLIKEKKAYWWSLCDSGVLVSRGDKNIFQSKNGWADFPQDWIENKFDKEKIIDRHKNYRNVVSGGELVGYGVVDGEENAKAYLNYGVVDLEDNDLIFLYTDGFENYFSINEFIDIFKIWPKNIKEQIENIISNKSKKDPNKFGREKTLIAVSF